MIEPLMEIKRAVVPDKGLQLISSTAIKELRKLSEDEKLEVLLLLGGLCEIVRKELSLTEEQAARTVALGSKNQVWGAILNDGSKSP